MSYTCFDYQTIQFEMFCLRTYFQENPNQIAMTLSNFLVKKTLHRNEILWWYHQWALNYCTPNAFQRERCAIISNVNHLIRDLICFHRKVINSISILINWDIVNVTNFTSKWETSCVGNDNNKKNKWNEIEMICRTTVFHKITIAWVLIWCAHNNSQRISFPCLLSHTKNESKWIILWT